MRPRAAAMCCRRSSRATACRLFLSRPPLAFGRILDPLAILRLVNPRTPLRFAGGRHLLTDEQAAEAIAVGIDAGIQGPLLTTPGKDYADDRQLALAAGYEVVQS